MKREKTGGSAPLPLRDRLRIISGGQTGADRAALDWAIACGVRHGGWCPRGRWAEDGPVSSRYRLRQTSSAHPAQRTERNVLEADGTVIISLRRQLSGGSALTRRLARFHGKPCLHVSRPEGVARAARRLRAFVVRWDVRVLNVAGPRESSAPGVGAFVRQVLTAAFESVSPGDGR